MYCYISLGSNLGWREKNINKAIFYIETTVGIILETESFLYEEEFIGRAGNNIYNKVIKIKTIISPEVLLMEVKRIEKLLKREKKIRWSDRIIDIDLLDFNGWIFASKNLILPHPRLHLRPAILQCICDIEKNWKHPVTGISIDKYINKTGKNKIRKCKLNF